MFGGVAVSVRHRLLLFLSLFLVSLVVVSNSEAARIKVKKAECSHKKKGKGVAVKKKPSRNFSRLDFRPRLLPLEEEYLVSELSPQENALLQKAFGLLGIKYRFGGSSYAGIDCSAFVKKICISNLPLPRTARQSALKYNRSKNCRRATFSFLTYANFPSHVGIYIGNNLMIPPLLEGR
jgi:hypothetical protein